MGKRRNGEGSWGTKIIKGEKYKYFRSTDGKYFYGKTEKDVKEKIKNYNSSKLNDKTSFGEFLLWYYNNIHKNTVEITTYQTYINICNSIVNSKHYNIGRIQLSRLTKKDNYFQLYINAITPHYSLNTIKGQMRIIKEALKYAEKNNMAESGLLSVIKYPKESNVGVKAKEIPFLSKKDALALYNESKATFKSSEKPKYSASAWAMLLLINTGLRIGELKALRWNDIDFDNKTMRIDESMAKIKNENKSMSGENIYTYKIKGTKNKSSNRVIPLNNVALEMLRNFEKLNLNHSDTDLVCINKNKESVKQQQICKVTDLMLKRIGSDVVHIGVHGLRHSFGSILYSQGAPLKTISKLLGHSNIATTANIYIGIENEHLVDIVKLLEKSE